MRRAPPVFVPPPPIAVFTWTGFYLGGNAGYAFGASRTTSYTFAQNSIQNSPGTAGIVNLLNGGNRNGFTGGGQIGYNYQFGLGYTAVIGIEADAQYLGLSNSNGAFTFVPNSPLTVGTAFSKPLPASIVGTQTKDNFFGTVRGRLGYAFDRVLPYATGGFAYSSHSIGYAVGGGLEFAVTNNITIRGEYLFVNLDKSSSVSGGTYNVASNTVSFNTNGGREHFNVARAALNYKFDFLSPLAAPVVARY